MLQKPCEVDISMLVIIFHKMKEWFLDNLKYKLFVFLIFSIYNWIQLCE